VTNTFSEIRRKTYSLLEHGDLVICQSIGLGDNRDQVDLGVKSAHNLDIKGLQRVASGLDEVDTGVDAVINDVRTVDLVLSLEVSIVSLFDVLHNWAPGIVVVDEVAESGGVDNG
jgi:hypothetical protein